MATNDCEFVCIATSVKIDGSSIFKTAVIPCVQSFVFSDIVTTCSSQGSFGRLCANALRYNNRTHTVFTSLIFLNI